MDAYLKLTLCVALTSAASIGRVHLEEEADDDSGGVGESENWTETQAASLSNVAHLAERMAVTWNWLAINWNQIARSWNRVAVNWNLGAVTWNLGAIVWNLASRLMNTLGSKIDSSI